MGRSSSAYCSRTAQQGFFAIEEVIHARVDLKRVPTVRPCWFRRKPRSQNRKRAESMSRSRAWRRIVWGPAWVLLDRKTLLASILRPNDQVNAMKRQILLAALLFQSCSCPVCRGAGRIEATPVNEPPRQLVIEVEIPAPIQEVWKAFSTSEGLSTWLFPENATVDLKPGGDWLVHFPVSSLGGGTDLA